MDPELYLDNKFYASKMGNGYLSTAGGKIYVFINIHIIYIFTLRYTFQTILYIM